MANSHKEASRKMHKNVYAANSAFGHSVVAGPAVV